MFLFVLLLSTSSDQTVPGVGTEVTVDTCLPKREIGSMYSTIHMIKRLSVPVGTQSKQNIDNKKMYNVQNQN